MCCNCILLETRLWVDVIIPIVSVVVLVVTLFVNNRKDSKIQKAEVYQRLELASIDLFRFEVQHSEKTWRLYNPKFDIINSKDYTEGTDGTDVSSKDKREILNHVTQQVNLFELAIELHDRGIFDHKIFTTWLAWIFETAEFKTFQDMWENEWDREQEEEPLRNHYTKYLVGLVDYAIEIHNKNGKDKFKVFAESLCEKRLVCNNRLCKKEWRRKIMYKRCTLAKFLEECCKET